MSAPEHRLTKTISCPHGRPYGTCLMCYHDLIGEQQSQIKRLERALQETHDAWTAETERRLAVQIELDHTVASHARLSRSWQEREPPHCRTCERKTRD